MSLCLCGYSFRLVRVGIKGIWEWKCTLVRTSRVLPVLLIGTRPTGCNRITTSSKNKWRLRYQRPVREHCRPGARKSGSKTPMPPQEIWSTEIICFCFIKIWNFCSPYYPPYKSFLLAQLLIIVAAGPKSGQINWERNFDGIPSATKTPRVQWNLFIPYPYRI